MTQSYGAVPPAINSSADAYPCASYPSEESESTSATRNDSSSSMTAIRCSPDTDRPFPWICAETRSQEWKVLPKEAAAVNYTAVLSLCPRPLWLLGLDHLGHPHEVSQGS